MKTLAALVTSLALTSIASADNIDHLETANRAERDTYIAVDGSLGSQRAALATVGASIGHRVSNAPLSVRGAVFYGVSSDDGRMQQVRVGLETRTCDARAWACAFAGMDLGYQHDHVVGTTSSRCRAPASSSAGTSRLASHSKRRSRVASTIPMPRSVLP